MKPDLLVSIVKRKDQCREGGGGFRSQLADRPCGIAALLRVSRFEIVGELRDCGTVLLSGRLAKADGQKQERPSALEDSKYHSAIKSWLRRKARPAGDV